MHDVHSFQRPCRSFCSLRVVLQRIDRRYNLLREPNEGYGKLLAEQHGLALLTPNGNLNPPTLVLCHVCRYNLLREQNEGYGKLLAELLSGGPLEPQHLPALELQIKSYIGTFNLDPNRWALQGV